MTPEDRVAQLIEVPDDEDPFAIDRQAARLFEHRRLGINDVADRVAVRSRSRGTGA